MLGRRRRYQEGPWPSILMGALLALGVILAYRRIYSPKESFAERGGKVMVLRGEEVYDDFYARLYPSIMGDKQRIKFELSQLYAPACQGVNTWLDLGCGVGWHTGSLCAAETECIGIDRSAAMIEHAKNNYPKCTFIQHDLDDGLGALPDADGLFCFNFTIYMMRDPRQFLKNCYNKLPPNGILVLHLVEPDEFDPRLEASVNVDDAERSIVRFSAFTYKSRFVKDRGDEDAAYVESIVPRKEGIAARRLEHLLTMPSKKQMIDSALQTGFILEEEVGIEPASYEHNYIVTFKRPS